MRDSPVKTLPYIFSDLDIETYHSTEGISRSSLMAFKRSPMHYWHEHLNPGYVKPKPSEEMIFGNACHSWVLEPHTFHERYRAYEKKERRSKAGKQYYEGERLAAAGTNRILLAVEHCEQIKAMGLAIDNNEMAAQLLGGGKVEHSLFWKDDETEILCKARPDVWHPEKNIIVDLKTTNDASPEAFRRDCFKYGYLLQAVFLYEGIKHCAETLIEDFVFVCVEKTPPYAIGCYQLDVTDIIAELDNYKLLLQSLQWCQANDEWPGYESKVVNLLRKIE
jgi:hypothetical protein